MKQQLEILIRAATQRGEALDHVLIFGPPGLGKTTLAHIIAAELGVNLRQTSGPVLERPGDLAALLTNLQARDVLFVDEIHRLAPVVEEVLYPAMEDYQLDHMIGGDTRAAPHLLGVGRLGFDTLDRKLLTAIIDRFDGGPVGIDSLAAALGEERGTLEDVTEPFLIQQGFLVRTARGRMATRASYLHLGLKAPERAAPLPLFEGERS